MEKERELYDAFVDVLLRKINDDTASPKELEIVMNFLKNNNIQATMKHKGLTELTKATACLPFEENELPTIRRFK